MASKTMWVAIMLAAMFCSVPPVRAQARPPDIDMLLNLDLFTQGTPAQGTGSMRKVSLMKQIETLQEMGAFNHEASPTPSPGGEPDLPPNEEGRGQSQER